MKWLRWYKRRTDVGRRDRVANILVRTTRHGVLRVYYSKLMENRMEKQCELMEMKHNDMLKNVKKLELKLKAAQYITEEELGAQIKKLEDEGDTIEDDVKALEEEIEGLRNVGGKLEYELKGHVQFSEDVPIQDKLFKICCFLKARGVSCRRDIRSITDYSKDNDKGVKTFTAGVARIKKGVKDATQQSRMTKDWNCPTDAVKSWDRKQLQEVHRGVKEVIIGVDQMHYFRARFPVDLCNELIDNVHILYEVVSRVYSERLALEEEEWRVKQKVRELDPYASQHGKLLNKQLQRQNSQKQNLEDLVSRDVRPNAPERRAGASPNRNSSNSPPPERKTSVSPNRKPEQKSPPPKFEDVVTAQKEKMQAQHDDPHRGLDFVESVQAGIDPPADKPRPAKKKPDPGFKIDDSMQVLSIHSHSAKVSGLKPGDTIVSVDLQKVTDKMGYVKRVKHAKVGQLVNFTFLRTTEGTRGIHKSAKIKMEEL